MAIAGLLGRPLLWGGMAAAVLGLEAAGMLDDLVAEARVLTGVDEAPALALLQEDLQKAEDKARKSLPRYLAAAVRAPDTWDTRAVKVAMSGAGGQAEEVWVEAFELTEGDRFAGVLTNAATSVPDLDKGARIEFSMDQIVDWAFVQNGRGYGYFTVHASLPYMPAAQAAVTRNFLNARPLPSGW